MHQEEKEEEGNKKSERSRLFFFFLQRAQPVLHKFLSVFRHVNQCPKFTSLLLLLSHAFI